VVEHDPITLAKEVATVDQLSGGRFVFGVGGGWNLEEMANHGTDPARRWPLLRERVLVMKAIWTQDEAEFHGAFVNFDRLWAWPKPVQRPHPPVLIGGNGPHTLKRVIDYGDGWDSDFRPRPGHCRAHGGARPYSGRGRPGANPGVDLLYTSSR
jgi:probable F420-dependent oxidoreductase